MRQWWFRRGSEEQHAWVSERAVGEDGPFELKCGGVCLAASEAKKVIIMAGHVLRTR